MEDFETAIRCYDNLLKVSGQEADHDDVAANLAAAKAQSATTTGTADISAPVIDSYEVQFNSACALIATGRFSDAETALCRAESISSFFQPLLTHRIMHSIRS